jgi:hypothetical protein
MKNKSSLVYLFFSVSFLLAACGTATPKTPEATVPQPINAPCTSSTECMTGLACIGAAADIPGTCQKTCADDAACGNGFLCTNGTCQATCAGVGEKCSSNRLCCFFDVNDDRASDNTCVLDETDGSDRCQLKVEATGTGAETGTGDVNGEAQVKTGTGDVNGEAAGN